MSTRTIDSRVLASVGWPDERVQVQPYVALKPGSSVVSRLSMIPSALRAMRAARLAMTAFRPDVAIGVGALASVPGVIAASRLNIPIALMEQNSVPGRATRFLAKRAAVTIAGLPFEPQFAEGWPCRVETIGTPVRRAIADLAGSNLSVRRERPRLLILGGSQGSRSVNHLVLSALAGADWLIPEWRIVHQTGEREVESITQEYSRLGRAAKVISFLPDIPDELRRATIVICRAGAVTLQELACAGLPAILIPLSLAADDHQMRNARRASAANGAMVVDETATDGAEQLRDLLKQLLTQSSTRDRLRNGIRTLARPHAAENAVALVKAIVRHR